MTISVFEVDPTSEENLQDASHLLMQYFDNWVLLRDMNRYNKKHVPGQVLYSDILRITEIIEKTRQGNHRIFIAEENGVHVGIGGISNSGELTHLYIPPENRGKGIAKHLMEKRIEEGGWYCICHFENFPIKSLVEKFNFVTTHKYQHYDVYVLRDKVLRGLQE